MYKFLKSVFSSLCLCMQIMMKKKNYVMFTSADLIFYLAL